MSSGPSVSPRLSPSSRTIASPTGSPAASPSSPPPRSDYVEPESESSDSRSLCLTPVPHSALDGLQPPAAAPPPNPPKMGRSQASPPPGPLHPDQDPLVLGAPCTPTPEADFYIPAVMTKLSPEDMKRLQRAHQKVKGQNQNIGVTASELRVSMMIIGTVLPSLIWGGVLAVPIAPVGVGFLIAGLCWCLALFLGEEVQQVKLTIDNSAFLNTWVYQHPRAIPIILVTATVLEAVQAAILVAGVGAVGFIASGVWAVTFAPALVSLGILSGAGIVWLVLRHIKMQLGLRVYGDPSTRALAVNVPAIPLSNGDTPSTNASTVN